MNFDELRSNHAQLIYEGFAILHQDGNLKVTFDFLLMPDIRFRPSLVFPNVSKERLDEISSKTLENLAFNLGMIELISYWKATCSPEILIKAGFLDKKQISWWKQLLIKGLGEFFYTNKIDFTRDELVRVKVASYSSSGKPFDRPLQDRDLSLVGGGKDSAVTLEILGKSGREFNCLTLNPTISAKQIIKISGSSNPIIVLRTIDPKLLELNKAGYLNGHTPISAYLAFLSVFAGVVYDYRNLIVSNEASSNEANTIWNGVEINHQYSKTFEFENLFKNYSKKYLSLNSNYFSILRPLSELQIAKLFAGMRKYHKDFRSCNKGSKTNSWCCECPKCVSTYLTLYPFLGDKLIEIFGKNLLEDENTIPVVEGLLRLNNILKPFECVATIEEVKVAIYLGVEYSRSKDKEVPLVLQRLEKYGSSNVEILDNWNGENNLLDAFQKLLKEKMNEVS